jgi:hypothetical protein
MILGVSTSKTHVYLAAVQDGNPLDFDPSRLDSPSLAAGTGSPARFLREIEDAMATCAPARIAILLPDPMYQASYDVIAPRASAEALLDLVADRLRIEAERVHPASLRSVFGLGRTGNVSALLAGVPELVRHGMYWGEGRRDAAAVAIALERRATA